MPTGAELAAALKSGADAPPGTVFVTPSEFAASGQGTVPGSRGGGGSSSSSSAAREAAQRAATAKRKAEAEAKRKAEEVARKKAEAERKRQQLELKKKQERVRQAIAEKKAKESLLRSQLQAKEISRKELEEEKKKIAAARLSARAKQETLIGPESSKAPPSQVQPFVSPSFLKRQKLKLSSAVSKTVKKGIGLGKNAIEIKKDVDRVINERLIRIGVTDKNIKRISRSLSSAEINQAANPLFFATKFKLKGQDISPGAKIREFQSEVITGVGIGAREDPTLTVASFGVGRLLPGTLAAVGKTKLVTKLGASTPVILKSVGKKVIPKALIGAYLAESGLEIAGAPSEARARLAGRKIATEIIPFELGARGGARGLLRRELRDEVTKAISKLPKKKQATFKDLMKKSDLLSKSKTTVREVDLKRLKRIPDSAKPTIIRFLKKNDIIVGGSLGQQTAVRVKRTLAQSDLDLYTEKDPINAARNLERELKKKGIKRVSRVKGKVTIGGKKAAEFHNIDRLLANIESVIPGWKNPKSFITRTKGGIRVPKITVQLKRKLVGGFTDPKRAKDLKDARDILNQLFKRAEQRARGKFFFREKNIKALEKTFGVKISRKALAKLKQPKLKITPTERLKKAKILKKAPPTTRVKVGVGVGMGKGTKISKKPKIKIKRLRIRPSQRAVKRRPSQLAITRPTKIKPSQPARKKKKKITPSGRPSQPLVRKRKKLLTPPGIPRKRLVPDRPSQPPIGGPRKKPLTKPTRAAAILRRKPLREKLLPLPRRRTIRKPKPVRAKGFVVEEKRGGKFVRLKGKPLSKKDALDKLAFRIDNKISRTGRIRPLPKVRKLGRITKKETGHFKRTRKNLRDFRIVKGKRVKLKPGTFIEKKGKALINTPGEKRQLRINRLARARTTRARPTKARPTPQRRDAPVQTTTKKAVMLKNLAKARAVKAAKARKRK